MRLSVWWCWFIALFFRFLELTTATRRDFANAPNKLRFNIQRQAAKEKTNNLTSLENV
jgi:hypothetical protein